MRWFGCIYGALMIVKAKIIKLTHLISGQYWQDAKVYKGRVLRLSILIGVLAIMIVSSVPSTYLGTATLQFAAPKTELASDAHISFVETISQQELGSKYERMLSENLAKGVVSKLKKFRLIELDRDLEQAISKYVIIDQVKHRVRTVLPFMPQQDSNALSPKQLGMLKYNYTLEKIIKSLHLSYSPNRNEVHVGYKDQSAIFAIIVAKIAAELYVQCVSETQMQMFEHVLDQIKQSNLKSYAVPKTPDTIKAYYHELNIPDLVWSIEFTSQEIKELKRQVKDSNYQLKVMSFIRNKVRKYGLNVTHLLRHKQITEHPLIQPFKRRVEIAEVQLSDLALLPEQVPSQVALAIAELMLLKKMLAWELMMLASNIESYFEEVKHEGNKYKTQLKVYQQKMKNLTRFQKELNQLSSSAGNHQISKFQEKLNQIASIAPTHSADTNIFIGKYSGERLKPNRTLIVSLSFFFSLFATSLLVLILVRLKATDRQKNLLVAAQKEL